MKCKRISTLFAPERKPALPDRFWTGSPALKAEDGKSADSPDVVLRVCQIRSPALFGALSPAKGRAKSTGPSGGGRCRRTGRQPGLRIFLHDPGCFFDFSSKSRGLGASFVLVIFRPPRQARRWRFPPFPPARRPAPGRPPAPAQRRRRSSAAVPRCRTGRTKRYIPRRPVRICAGR